MSGGKDRVPARLRNLAPSVEAPELTPERLVEWERHQVGAGGTVLVHRRDRLAPVLPRIKHRENRRAEQANRADVRDWQRVVHADVKPLNDEERAKRAARRQDRLQRQRAFRARQELAKGRPLAKVARLGYPA